MMNAPTARAGAPRSVRVSRSRGWRRPVLWLSAALLALAAQLTVAAQAQPLRIDVSGIGASQIPVAIANFGGAAAGGVEAIVRADLARSGLFRIIDVNRTLTETSALDLPAFRNQGADSLLVGSSEARPDGRVETRFKLVDTVSRRVIDEKSIPAAPSDQRLAGHRIADLVYEWLTGSKGVFSTRIAFVTHAAGRYRLNVAEWDGSNAQTALNSTEPIISPVWSPDGTRLAYVSFESHKPVVWVHALTTGQRRAVAEFRGSNSAPAWSPDGRRLAVTLTRDGGSQIYIISADGGDARRITQSSGIDTEPTFSPDGSTLYFTSDRGGSPQIYRMSANGGAATRVTFGSNYNVSPRVSPDGTLLAYITRREGRFHVGIKELNGGGERLLTEGGREESPSFSPNGRWLMYASQTPAGQVLMAVTTDGRNRQRLTSTAGDIREPAWGPFPH